MISLGARRKIILSAVTLLLSGCTPNVIAAAVTPNASTTSLARHFITITANAPTLWELTDDADTVLVIAYDTRKTGGHVRCIIAVDGVPVGDQVDPLDSVCRWKIGGL